MGNMFSWSDNGCVRGGSSLRAIFLASQWPGGYVLVGQIYRYFLGIVFSVELFLLSYLPWDSGGVNTFREVG